VNLLAFDTSTERLALGVSSPGRRFTVEAEGGARASATLLPQIEALLARAGLAFAELDAIAFGRGPGAFTGLRTSCAVAQGLGFGLGRPLLPIDSLLIVAEDARGDAGALEVAVAMDARMDEVYAARWRFSQGRWAALEAPALYTLEALHAAWREAHSDLVAGSALQVFGERLVRPAGAVEVPRERDRAGALLRLAESAAAAGEGVEAAAALPLYLRDKVALTTAERDTERAAKAAAKDMAKAAPASNR
jgi:tRNA threonylcarbamoyladenosine biosynthesis protein TsaB